MFGAYYFARPYYAEADPHTPPPTVTRADCGGVWGTATFGQPCFGGHRQCGAPPVQPPRADCGGAWGTATWGQPYFGGHRQCGATPPTPPPTPEEPRIGLYLGAESAFAFQGRPRRRPDEEDEEAILAFLAALAATRPGRN